MSHASDLKNKTQEENRKCNWLSFPTMAFPEKIRAVCFKALCASMGSKHEKTQPRPREAYNRTEKMKNENRRQQELGTTNSEVEFREERSPVTLGDRCQMREIGAGAGLGQKAVAQHPPARSPGPPSSYHALSFSALFPSEHLMPSEFLPPSSLLLSLVYCVPLPLECKLHEHRTMPCSLHAWNSVWHGIDVQYRQEGKAGLHGGCHQ